MRGILSQKGFYFPTNDVGLIRTSKNEEFVGNFVLETNSDRMMSSRVIDVVLYGCGRIDYSTKVYSRTTGSNVALRLGSVLFFLGNSTDNKVSLRTKVSIAPNDSGGPIVEASSGKIIGVMSKTTLKDSLNYGISTLSSGSFVNDNANFEFILSEIKNDPIL